MNVSFVGKEVLDNRHVSMECRLVKCCLLFIYQALQMENIYNLTHFALPIF